MTHLFQCEFRVMSFHSTRQIVWLNSKLTIAKQCAGVRFSRVFVRFRIEFWMSVLRGRKSQFEDDCNWRESQWNCLHKVESHIITQLFELHNRNSRVTWRKKEIEQLTRAPLVAFNEITDIIIDNYMKTRKLRSFLILKECQLFEREPRQRFRMISNEKEKNWNRMKNICVKIEKWYVCQSSIRWHHETGRVKCQITQICCFITAFGKSANFQNENVVWRSFVGNSNVEYCTEYFN